MQKIYNFEKASLFIVYQVNSKVDLRRYMKSFSLKTCKYGAKRGYILHLSLLLCKSIQYFIFIFLKKINNNSYRPIQTFPPCRKNFSYSLKFVGIYIHFHDSIKNTKKYKIIHLNSHHNFEILVLSTSLHPVKTKNTK